MYTNRNYFFSQCILLVHVVLILNWHSILGCTSSEPAEFRVLKKTDSGGKQVVVAVGENAKLYCRTNVPWKKCIWKPPRNGVRQLRCEFTRADNIRPMCPSFPEIHFDRVESDKYTNNCAINIAQIKDYHDGDWKCEFELDLPEESEIIHVKERVKLVARGYRYP